MRLRLGTAGGFSLIEVLVAATTIVVALSGLAQLTVAAGLADRRAQTMTLAAINAQEKLEQLIPHAALDPIVAGSPSDGLSRNVDGYCEFLDAHGNVVGSGTTAPPGAAFVRRWTVEPLVTGTGVAIALRVLVVDARRTGVDAHTAIVVRHVS